LTQDNLSKAVIAHDEIIVSESPQNGDFKMKRRLFILLAGSILLSGFLTACNRTIDTRQFVELFGVVFTNEASDVINELYVFPSSTDGTDVFEQDMGPDIIKNTREQRRLGSFGVTLEVVTTSYNVIVRDMDRGVYIFENTPLTNACEAILTFEAGNPVLTIHHRNGTVDAMTGRRVQEGDAPAHTQNPMRREIPIRFTVNNYTGDTITFISMREADDPDKGEVYLFERALDNDSSANVSIRLFEEDEEITAWIIYIETENGISMISDGSFNPWETEELDLTISDGVLIIDER